MEDLKLTAYQVFNRPSPVSIIPGVPVRKWMDETANKFAYRCLPLTMANQHGWSLFPKKKIKCIWNGEPNMEAINIIEGQDLVSSAFGSGILTFHVYYLFKTPPGYNLFISGAPNYFIENAWPLTGVYESDWSPYSFTMNWKILKPGVVEFETTDPFCYIFPIERKLTESFKLERKLLSDNPEMENQFKIFQESRTEFNSKLKNDPDFYNKWQKDYFQGKYPDGTKCPYDHQTKLKLNGSIED